MSSPTNSTPQLTQAVPPVARTVHDLPAATVQKLQRAAATSKTPFATLVSIASSESNFNPAARNQRSTATGAFQITENTWMHLVKRYGAALGRSDLAGMVREDSTGKLSVAPE